MTPQEPPSSTPSAHPPAPWGSPPTPLLPAWYLENHWGVALPRVLRSAMTHRSPGCDFEPRTVGDLSRLWEYRSEPLSVETRRSLIQFASRLTQPPPDHVAIPEGTDIDRLFRCPLRNRTRNCIRRSVPSFSAKPDQPGRLAQPISVAQLLAIANFGFNSLIDVMCVTEAAIDSGYLWPHVETRLSPGSPSDLPDPSAIAWSSAITLLKRLLNLSMEFDGSASLGDALRSDLVAFASVLGLTEQLHSIKIADLADGSTLSEEALGDLADSWQGKSPTARMVISDRLLSDDPLSLQEVADKAGLSRERIRQIQKKVEAEWFGADGGCVAVANIAELLRPQIPPITNENEFEKHITSVFPEIARRDSGVTNHSNPQADPEPESALNSSVVRIARHLLRTELGYSRLDGILLNPDAVVVVQDLRQAAKAMADDEGIVKEYELREHLPDGSWGQDWEALTRAAGLHRLNGLIMLRDTGRARAKAALLSIGHSATKEEIAQRCGQTPYRVSSHLSAISDVVRADKTRWGLTDWVEDEYEGIPAEIIQRIEEDGGATRLERLLEELPRLFGVTQGSVEAYAKSARFKIADGYVSLADPSLITLRALEDVAHGRTADGLLFFGFKVESRYFDGYSLAGLPPEIAKAVGCEPDGRLRVPVLAPEGCGPVSVSWPLSSLTGATLGYLSAPLRLLGAKQGETVHLVLETTGGISLRRLSSSESTTQAPEPGNNSSERATELLQRMKNRRRGF